MNIHEHMIECNKIAKEKQFKTEFDILYNKELKKFIKIVESDIRKENNSKLYCNVYSRMKNNCGSSHFNGKRLIFKDKKGEYININNQKHYIIVTKISKNGNIYKEI